MCLTKLKLIKVYLTKLATDFYCQPRFLLGEKASFVKHISGALYNKENLQNTIPLQQ
jgi:hypothetical protein